MIAIRDIREAGFFFSSVAVPKGTRGVVVEVERGWLGPKRLVVSWENDATGQVEFEDCCGIAGPDD